MAKLGSFDETLHCRCLGIEMQTAQAPTTLQRSTHSTFVGPSEHQTEAELARDARIAAALEKFGK